MKVTIKDKALMAQLEELLLSMGYSSNTLTLQLLIDLKKRIDEQWTNQLINI